MNHTDKVLQDVRAERVHQVDRGWTTQHDDEHWTDALVRLANQYAHKPGKDADPNHITGRLYDRHRLVQAAALLVAAVEAMDRRDDAR